MSGADRHILPLPEIAGAVKLLIVVAPYHKAVTDRLVAGAHAVAGRVGAQVDLVEVPSALEIPTAIRFAARMADYDGFIALGCVIRGETSSYEIITRESAQALSIMGVEGLCIGNGILAVESMAQAAARAQPVAEGADLDVERTIDANKGASAAAAALHLIALSRKWARQTKGIGFRPSGESFRIAGEPEGENRA